MNHREFQKQFRRLKKAIPGDYVVLSVEAYRYTVDGEEGTRISAYASSRGWTENFGTVEEAVNALLEMPERRPE